MYAYVSGNDLCLFKQGAKPISQAFDFEDIPEHLTVGNQYVSDVVAIAMESIVEEEDIEEYSLVYILNTRGVGDSLSFPVGNAAPHCGLLRNVFTLYIRDVNGDCWSIQFMHEDVFMRDSIEAQAMKIVYKTMASTIEDDAIWIGPKTRVLESEYNHHTFRKGNGFIRLVQHVDY
jgi:hypothetical protein